MTRPVNLTDLSSITDGNKEIELALFEEFYTSSETGLRTLAANCTDGANEIWRATAHALKGGAYNIGALELGGLCKQAQENAAIPADAKRALLEKIQAEYAAVKAYLQTVHAGTQG